MALKYRHIRVPEEYDLALQKLVSNNVFSKKSKAMRWQAQMLEQFLNDQLLKRLEGKVKK